jgi:hypothetical protein
VHVQASMYVNANNRKPEEKDLAGGSCNYMNQCCYSNFNSMSNRMQPGTPRHLTK